LDTIVQRENQVGQQRETSANIQDEERPGGGEPLRVERAAHEREGFLRIRKRQRGGPPPPEGKWAVASKTALRFIRAPSGGDRGEKRSYANTWCPRPIAVKKIAKGSVAGRWGWAQAAFDPKSVLATSAPQRISENCPWGETGWHKKNHPEHEQLPRPQNIVRAAGEQGRANTDRSS